MGAIRSEDRVDGIVLDREASDRLYNAIVNPNQPSDKLITAARKFKEEVTSGRLVIQTDYEEA